MRNNSGVQWENEPMKIANTLSRKSCIPTKTPINTLFHAFGKPDIAKSTRFYSMYRWRRFKVCFEQKYAIIQMTGFMEYRQQPYIKSIKFDRISGHGETFQKIDAIIDDQIEEFYKENKTLIDNEAEKILDKNALIVLKGSADKTKLFWEEIAK